MCDGISTVLVQVKILPTSCDMPPGRARSLLLNINSIELLGQPMCFRCALGLHVTFLRAKRSGILLQELL
jgi:hypothetical protein